MAPAILTIPSLLAAPSDRDLLNQAKERIQKHRRSTGTILLRDESGKPQPGAKIKIEQKRHDFLFGCNFFMFGRVGDPAVEEKYRSRFAALLNFATLGFYWGAYEPERGRPNYDYTAQVIEWCRAHHITTKGHPLAWDHPASSPKWLPSDFSEIERLSTARTRDCIERFKDGIDIWDVVNEPTDLARFKNPMNDWARHLGAVDFTKLHLKVARAAASPSATLLVNDYRTDPAFAKILEALRENGKLMFDAIGIQSHMHDHHWALSKIWEVCDRFAALDLPIHFTETTVVSGPRTGPGENWGQTNAEGEARQAEYVPNFYTMLFAHPAVRALTWWDFSDRGAWQRAAAGLVRADQSPKPAYERLLALIKNEWWTRVEGQTDSKGEFAFAAFHGTHQVTATLANGRDVAKELRWNPAAERRIELTI